MTKLGAAGSGVSSKANAATGAGAGAGAGASKAKRSTAGAGAGAGAGEAPKAAPKPSSSPNWASNLELGCFLGLRVSEVSDPSVNSDCAAVRFSCKREPSSSNPMMSLAFSRTLPTLASSE